MLDMAKDTQYPVRKLAYFSEEMATAISDFRFKNRISSENEAIRMLIQRGLSIDAHTASLIEAVLPILARANATDEEISRIALAANQEFTAVFEQELKDKIQKAKYSHPMAGVLTSRSRS